MSWEWCSCETLLNRLWTVNKRGKNSCSRPEFYWRYPHWQHASARKASGADLSYKWSLNLYFTDHFGGHCIASAAITTIVFIFFYPLCILLFKLLDLHLMIKVLILSMMAVNQGCHSLCIQLWYLWGEISSWSKRLHVPAVLSWSCELSMLILDCWV